MYCYGMRIVFNSPTSCHHVLGSYLRFFLPLRKRKVANSQRLYFLFLFGAIFVLFSFVSSPFRKVGLVTVLFIACTYMISSRSLLESPNYHAGTFSSVVLSAPAVCLVYALLFSCPDKSLLSLRASIGSTLACVCVCAEAVGVVWSLGAQLFRCMRAAFSRS